MFEKCLKEVLFHFFALHGRIAATQAEGGLIYFLLKNLTDHPVEKTFLMLRFNLISYFFYFEVNWARD